MDYWVYKKFKSEIYVFIQRENNFEVDISPLFYYWDAQYV